MLNEIKRHINIRTDVEFAKYLGIKPNVLSNWHKRGTFRIDVITQKCEFVNKDWLLTGNGEMLKSESPVQINTIPLLPISAQGGSLNEFMSAVGDSDCEQVISPITGADFAITVAGESMAPEYSSGSQILIKQVNEKAFIDWGKVYVLDTCNGTVIKKLLPAVDGSSDKVKCVSLNPDYPSFEVKFKDIYGVYRVMMCMSIK